MDPKSKINPHYISLYRYRATARTLSLLNPRPLESCLSIGSGPLYESIKTFSTSDGWLVVKMRANSALIRLLISLRYDANMDSILKAWDITDSQAEEPCQRRSKSYCIDESILL